MGWLVQAVEAAYKAIEPIKRAARKAEGWVSEKYHALDKVFNFKVAVKSALVGAAIAIAANISAGLAPALYAAAKQYAFTFVTSGLSAKLCEYIATRPITPGVALAAAAIIPPLLSGTADYLMHYFTHTPHPLLTVLPGAIPNFAIYYAKGRFFQWEIGIRTKKLFDKYMAKLDGGMHWLLRGDLIPNGKKPKPAYTRPAYTPAYA